MMVSGEREMRILVESEMNEAKVIEDLPLKGS